MKSTWALWCAVMLAVSCVVCSPAAGDNLVLQVPDWNQPGVAGYNNWCSPTAGGNLMGFWEDVNGFVGLADRQVMPAGPAYAGNANIYQQGLYQDGMVEMGFFMNTQGWVNPNTQFPPNTWFGTFLNMIGPGMLAYATTGWVDPGPTSIVKVNFGLPPYNMGAADIGIDTVFGAQAWANYVTEIDAGRPALVSFITWVGGPNGVTHIVKGQTVHEYIQDSTDPHTVVGVGYLDKNPLAFGRELYPGEGDEWIIAQDGWGNTPQYVAVPYDSLWRQNDYVYDIPEPATMGLMTLGLIGLIVRRKQK